jgi:hypothetical protein
MACAVESVVSKLPQTLGMGFRWKIRFVLEKSKSSRHNVTMKELKAVKSLRLNKDIRILLADKANCTVVFVESKYTGKLNTLLKSRVYEPLPNILQLKLRGKYRNSFPDTKILYQSKTQVDSVPQQTSTSIWSSHSPQTGHSSEVYSEFYRFPLLCSGRFSP